MFVKLDVFYIFFYHPRSHGIISFLNKTSSSYRDVQKEFGDLNISYIFPIKPHLKGIPFSDTVIVNSYSILIIVLSIQTIKHKLLYVYNDSAFGGQ